MIKKSTLLKTIIPAIMVFFFIRNLILVETSHMDSWMGGGMRMFATIDKMLYRVSGFEVNYNNQTYFVNLRNIHEFKDDDIAARILPSEERAIKILNKIKTYEWCYNIHTDQIQLKKVENKRDCNQTISNETITKFSVYAIKFDDKTNKIELKTLNP